jgi:hypothetical protein
MWQVLYSDEQETVKLGINLISGGYLKVHLSSSYMFKKTSR